MGCLFQSTTDTEVIIHLIARSNYATLVDRMIDALRQVEGAYSLVALTNEKLIGVRDPLGVRPLCIGKLDDAWILASETCALDIIGAHFVRDVEPGEIVIIDGTGLRSIKPFPRQQRRFCVFEYIYFARPDSMIEGVNVYEARKRIGAKLARESPVDGRRDRPGAGLRRAGGDRLLAAVGHPVRARHHPQPLCRPHLHRADRPHPPSRRAPEAQRQPRPDRGQARDAGRRIPSCAAPPRRRSSKWCATPAPRKCICASPARRPPIPASTASTRPTRDKLLAARYDVEGMAKFIGVDSVWPSSPSTASTGRWEPQGARRPAAGLLRRLLHRRLPDRARRRERRRGPPALAARRAGLVHRALPIALPLRERGEVPRRGGGVMGQSIGGGP